MTKYSWLVLMCACGTGSVASVEASNAIDPSEDASNAVDAGQPHKDSGAVRDAQQEPTTAALDAAVEAPDLSTVDASEEAASDAGRKAVDAGPVEVVCLAGGTLYACTGYGPTAITYYQDGGSHLCSGGGAGMPGDVRCSPGTLCIVIAGSSLSGVCCSEPGSGDPPYTCP